MRRQQQKNKHVVLEKAGRPLGRPAFSGDTRTSISGWRCSLYLDYLLPAALPATALPEPEGAVCLLDLSNTF